MRFMTLFTATDSPAHNQAALPAPEALTALLCQVLPEFGQVQWVGSTGSTNQDLMQRLRMRGSGAFSELAELPWLAGAHEQTAARGRAGRPWQNAPGTTLMFSCAFKTEIPLGQLAGLSPALGVATCEALRGLIGPNANRLALKWPNDLQWDAGKLAGILVESLMPAGAPAPYLVVGIGLNLRNAQILSTLLQREIADWSQICATPVWQLIATIAQAWAQALQDYARGGYARFVERFGQVDVLAHTEVVVTDQGKTLLTGRAQGTDDQGHLLVATSEGIVPVLVGDVSVRPTPQQGTL